MPLIEAPKAFLLDTPEVPPGPSSAVLPALDISGAVEVFAHQYDARRKLKGVLTERILASIEVSSGDASTGLVADLLTWEDAQVLWTLARTGDDTPAPSTLRQLAQMLVLSESATCRRLARLQALRDVDGQPLIEREGRHPIGLAEGGQRIWASIVVRLRQVAALWLQDTSGEERLRHQALVTGLKSRLTTHCAGGAPRRTSGEPADGPESRTARPGRIDPKALLASLSDDALENLLCLLDIGPLLDHFGRELAQQAGLSLELVDILVMLALEFPDGFPREPDAEGSPTGWMAFRTLNAALLHGSDSLFSRSLKTLSTGDVARGRGPLVRVKYMETPGTQGRRKGVRISEEGYRRTWVFWQHYREVTEQLLEEIPVEWWQGSKVVNSAMVVRSDMPLRRLDPTDDDTLSATTTDALGTSGEIRGGRPPHLADDACWPTEPLPEPLPQEGHGVGSIRLAKRLYSALDDEDPGALALATRFQVPKEILREQEDLRDEAALPSGRIPTAGGSGDAGRAPGEPGEAGRPAPPDPAIQSQPPARPSPIPYHSDDEDINIFLKALNNLGNVATLKELKNCLDRAHGWNEEKYQEYLGLLLHRGWIHKPGASSVWLVLPREPAPGVAGPASPAEDAAPPEPLQSLAPLPAAEGPPSSPGGPVA